jgi:dynein heavy chain
LYHVLYGYELLPSSPGYIYTSFFERCILTLAGALAINMGALVRGPNNVGKRSTVKAFSQLIGKELFTFDCYGVNFDFIFWIFQGMAAGGFWVMFENIQNLDSGLLPSFCNIASKELFLALLTLACRY